jgi:hypothetical protein
MKVTKKILGSLEKAYATAIMEINGETNFLVATEGQGSCISYKENSSKGSIVWDNPGGTMNIVSIPGKKNEFIATQHFFPTFQAEESIIVHAKFQDNNTWQVNPIMKIPYLHRFDLFIIEGKLFFIGSTLCESKQFKDDWSKPGKVYIGTLNDEIASPFDLKPIINGITKNHGFCKGTWNNRSAYLVSGSEGVFVIYIPKEKTGIWEIEQIMNHEVSDMAICDIDSDGVEELATIEGFHGNKGKIYKKINGVLTSIHEHEYEFGHVVWGGKIVNKPSFIIGGRKGNRDVVCFQMDKESGKIVEFLIDNTGGPSNIAVINKNDKDLVLAANREIGEIALYEITE